MFISSLYTALEEVKKYEQVVVVRDHKTTANLMSESLTLVFLVRLINLLVLPLAYCKCYIINTGGITIYAHYLSC